MKIIICPSINGADMRSKSAINRHMAENKIVPPKALIIEPRVEPFETVVDNASLSAFLLYKLL